MKALAILALILTLGGCKSFDIARVGTILDGNICLWQDDVTAKQRINTVIGLLDPMRDQQDIADAITLRDMKRVSASELCNQTRALEGMLHRRYQAEGTYQYQP